MLPLGLPTTPFRIAGVRAESEYPGVRDTAEEWDLSPDDNGPAPCRVAVVGESADGEGEPGGTLRLVEAPAIWSDFR